MNHHRLFNHVRRSDDVLIGANLLLLLGVVWIPYPTSVMAQAVTKGQLREAAILYNGSYLVLAMLFNLLLFTCTHRGLVDRNYDGVRGIARKYATGPLMYLVCLATTWWSVPLSLAINGGMAVYFLCTPQGEVKQPGPHGQ